MSNFNFEINETKTHKERHRSSQIFNLSISIAIFILLTVTSNWYYGVIISGVFLIIQYFKSSRWDEYFILCINRAENNLHLKYKKQDEIKVIDGNIRDFVFKKETALNRTRTIYLAIYYENNLIIKQFENENWNEILMDEVITKTKET
jgi:hypothetical protein